MLNCLANALCREEGCAVGVGAVSTTIPDLLLESNDPFRFFSSDSAASPVSPSASSDDYFRWWHIYSVCLYDRSDRNPVKPSSSIGGNMSLSKSSLVDSC